MGLPQKIGRVDRYGWCSNPKRYGVLFYNVGMNTVMTVEPPHDKTNKMTCVPSEDSDQPGQSDQSRRCPHEEA